MISLWVGPVRRIKVEEWSGCIREGKSDITPSICVTGATPRGWPVIPSWGGNTGETGPRGRWALPDLCRPDVQGLRLQRKGLLKLLITITFWAENLWIVCRNVVILTYGVEPRCSEKKLQHRSCNLITVATLRLYFYGLWALNPWRLHQGSFG